MAVIQWPSQVPYEAVANDGLSQSYTQPLLSETEGGPPIMRRRPGPRAAETPWRSVLLTEEQWEAFELFVREDLYQGTLPFGMPVFRPGSGYVERVCQIKSGVWTTDASTVPYYSVAFTLIIYNW